MNLRQLFLIVLALTLLATLQLSINASILRASLVTLDNEARIDAISIAQAMIDEINTKAFDSVTVSKVAHFTNELTPSSRFGPDLATEKSVPVCDQEPFQSKTKFNDVDDYNRYTRLDNSSHLGTFFVRDSVIYVSASDQTTYSSTPTWYKKIIVVVKQSNLVDSIIISSNVRNMKKFVSFTPDSIMMKSLAVYREYF